MSVAKRNMAKAPVIDIRPCDLETVREILRRHVPNHEVLAFGSRARWTARQYSDLDLAIRGDKAIPTDIIYAIKNELSESRLPMMVDVLDMASVSEKFRGIIEEEYAVVQQAGRSGWRNTKLGQICRINPDSRDSDWYHEAIQYIDISSVGSGIFNESPRKIPIGEAPSRAKRLVAKGDTIVSTVRPNRRSFMFLNSPSSDTVASTGFAVLRARRDVADPRFLYYLVTHQEFTDYLVSRTEGSAYPAVNPSVFGDADVCVPPLSEQRKIARILGALDDKIELNRRTNKTLEAMAQAIFKSWFVDFDPVRAKAALKRRPSHHSPLERESARQGRKPEVALPITPPLRGSRQDEGASPKSRRWGDKTVRRFYTPHTLKQAKTLRQTQTDPENLLWHYLRDKQLDGHKFRRQQPIGPYIADFACMSQKLLIELDGGQHATRHAADQKRERFLRDKGYRVLRFWNHEVFQQCFDVLEEIYRALQYPRQPAPDGLSASTPPPGGSDWDEARARAYLAAMDPEVAALFPDEFEDSELGEIPRGWGVAALGDVADLQADMVQPQKFPEEVLEHYSIPSHDGGRLPVIERGANIKSGKYLVPKNAVLISKLNPRFPRVWLPDVSGAHRPVCSTEFLPFVPRYPDWRPYLYQLALSPAFQAKIANLVTGTSGSHQRAKPLDILGISFPAPSAKICAMFSVMTNSLSARTQTNLFEAQDLASTRDVLLPMLISGRIRLEATGKQVKAPT